MDLNSWSGVFELQAQQTTTGRVPSCQNTRILVFCFGTISGNMTESCSVLTVTPPADQINDNVPTVDKVVPETTIKINNPEYGGVEERLLGPAFLRTYNPNHHLVQ